MHKQALLVVGFAYMLVVPVPDFEQAGHVLSIFCANLHLLKAANSQVHPSRLTWRRAPRARCYAPRSKSNAFRKTNLANRKDFIQFGESLVNSLWIGLPLQFADPYLGRRPA